MQPEPFSLLAPSHILFAAFCIAIVIFLPKVFIGSSEKTIRNVKYILAFLMLSHEIIDPFFKVSFFGGWLKIHCRYICVLSQLGVFPSIFLAGIGCFSYLLTSGA